jgi:hypothetical protein
MPMIWTNVSNVSLRVFGDVRYYDKRRPRPTPAFQASDRSYNDFKYSTRSFFSCSVKPSLLKLS